MSELLRTGVGSLPHTDPSVAAEFVIATADIPYLPQLPNRHPEESMLLQWGDGLAGAGVTGWSLAAGAAPGPRHEAFVGAAATLARIGAGPLKTQATGPVTLAAALRSGGVGGAELLDRVVEGLTARIVDHLAQLRSCTDELVVVLDEPALAAMGGVGPPLPAVAVDALEAVISGIDADVGVHCCGDTDWGTIASLRPQWLSWDVAELGGGFRNGLDDVAAALAAGTRIMWGVVPTTPGPLPEQNVLLGRYGTALAHLVVAGAPLATLQQDAWFTPACGLAGLSVGDAEQVAKALAILVEEIQLGW